MDANDFLDIMNTPEVEDAEKTAFRTMLVEAHPFEELAQYRDFSPLDIIMNTLQGEDSQYGSVFYEMKDAVEDFARIAERAMTLAESEMECLALSNVFTQMASVFSWRASMRETITQNNHPIQVR